MTTNESMPNAERAAAMSRMRAEGHSLQAIADAFDLTRERVRQIIRDAGGPSSQEALAARRARAQQQRLALREQALRLCRENPGISVDDLARALGVPVSVVRSALGRDARVLLVSTHSAQSLFSDEDVLGHIRQAAAMADRPLTVRRYEELRQQFGGASAPLVLQRFGTWRAACVEAGVEHGRPVRTSYSRRWSREALVGWVATYLSSDGVRGSFADYEVWARRTEGAPSGQTIRTQLGRWSNAKSEAVAQLLARATAPLATTGLQHGHPDGEHPAEAGPDGEHPHVQAGAEALETGDSLDTPGA